MDQDLVRSIAILRVLRCLRLTVIALRSLAQNGNMALTFRITENNSEAVSGNMVPIVHTERAFGPTAR
jgi:hypothetical protein